MGGTLKAIADRSARLSGLDDDKKSAKEEGDRRDPEGNRRSVRQWGLNDDKATARAASLPDNWPRPTASGCKKRTSGRPPRRVNSRQKEVPISTIGIPTQGIGTGAKSAKGCGATQCERRRRGGNDKAAGAPSGSVKVPALQRRRQGLPAFPTTGPDHQRRGAKSAHRDAGRAKDRGATQAEARAARMKSGATQGEGEDANEPGLPTGRQVAIPDIRRRDAKGAKRRPYTKQRQPQIVRCARR